MRPTRTPTRDGHGFVGGYGPRLHSQRHAGHATRTPEPCHTPQMAGSGRLCLDSLQVGIYQILLQLLRQQTHYPTTQGVTQSPDDSFESPNHQSVPRGRPTRTESKSTNQEKNPGEGPCSWCRAAAPQLEPSKV